MPVRRRLENARPRLGLGLLLAADGLLHLGKLEHHERVFAVAVAMVVSKKLEPFLLPALADQPTRGLRCELNRDEDIYRHGQLDQVWDPPGPRVSDVAGAEVDPRGEDGPKNVIRVLVGV
jgi:hypothetical protein